MLDEARSEYQFPYPRMQSVGADDEVEPARRGVLEGDIDAVAVVG